MTNASQKTVFKSLFYLGIFILGLALGVILQKQNFSQPVKRILRGLPAVPAAPNTSVLTWNETHAKKPQYALDGLDLAELNANRRIYLDKIKDLIGFSRYPLQYRPSIEVTEKVLLEGLIREKILIETEPGIKIPFYLFLPNDTAARPAILVLHGHSAGKIETAGLLDSYQHGNALALAKAGFVTIAPDFRGFGELGWIGDWEDPIGHAYGRNIHIQDVLSNLERGRTVLGTYLYDLSHILNYVKGLSRVDQQRLGVAGTSMGADTALWLSILYPEFKTAVISYPPMMGLPEVPNAANTAHPCINTIPGIALYFNPEDILLLAAPTPMLITYRPSPAASSNRQKLNWLYKTSGDQDKIIFKPIETGEDFDSQAAIEWFKKWLSGESQN